MTALCAAHNRRRRRKLLLPLAVTAILLLLFHSYAEVAVNILFRGPYIAARRSAHIRISAAADDGFDVSFRAYPATPTATSAVADDVELPVPPLIHHILLGKPAVDPTRNANLTAARQACLDMHPGYEFKFWTDGAAAAFVREHFPRLFEMWSGYRMTIQKADSLRYMLLYVHGGMAIRSTECGRPY
jgi:mannosyltransferase OCH1-like enzyme